VDILYFPVHRGVSLDVEDFLSREENRSIKKLAMTIADFAALRETQNLGWWRFSASCWELMLGLKQLEVLYIIEGDERMRVQLPWKPIPRIRPSIEWGDGKKLADGMWTGSEEVELVGFGEGTFKKPHIGWGGRSGNQGAAYPPKADAIKHVEETWREIVEVEKMHDGMSGWKAARVEVKCKWG
jgi:hypothetical protein